MRNLFLLVLVVVGCKQDSGINSVAGSTDSDDPGAGETSSPTDDSESDTSTPSTLEADGSTCDSADNDGNGVIDDQPTTLTVSVDPGTGQCVVHESDVIDSAGEYAVEVCDEAAYVACNVEDGSAEITAVTGVYTPDGCAQALASNSSWPAKATTCGWLSKASE